MRAENVPSATVAGSRQQTAQVSAELPYWIPGIGAWPGHVITRMDGDKPVKVWRYEAPGPNKSKLSGQRRLVDLLLLSPSDAEHILEALEVQPEGERPSRASWTRRGRALTAKVQQGAPVEVAEAFAELRMVKPPRTLAFSERRLMEQAGVLLRSVLDALPDSPAKSRALEILTDDRKPCPSS